MKLDSILMAKEFIFGNLIYSNEKTFRKKTQSTSIQPFKQLLGLVFFLYFYTSLPTNYYMYFLNSFKTLVLNCIFFLITYTSFSQPTINSYNELVNYIDNDSIPSSKKIAAINSAINKTSEEKKFIEKFRILELKCFFVDNEESLIVSDELIHLANELKNDSLIEISLTTKSTAFYVNRNFKDALTYSLKAIDINKKTNNKNELYGTLIDIGNIYYHTQDYTKAEKYYKDALEYFKNEKEHKGSQIHFLLVYNLGKVYWRSSNTNDLTEIIKEFESMLTENTSIIDRTYLNYLKGGLSYLNKDYRQSIIYFNNSIQNIKINDDYTNEHVGYLYLGKNYWELNNKKLAIEYFKKVDELFVKRNFLNYELRDAYDYLIEFYKENEDLNKQLYFTERLISINKQFENEQKDITSSLHNDYETKKLEASKHELKNSLLITKIFLLFVISIFLIICYYIFKKIKKIKREKELWKNKFNEIFKKLDIKNDISDTPILKENSTELRSTNKTSNTSDLSNSELKILKYLKVFEYEKRFLNPIKIEDLVDDLSIGRTTLSVFFNNYKEGFNNYINNLRINQILIDLKNDEALREISIDKLSLKYGYNNSKTFFNQFKRITGFPPAFYIKQLNLEDSKSEN